MEVYRGRNRRALPSFEGLVENLEIQDFMSKFNIKGVEPIFVFGLAIEDISGKVRVHYERSASGRFGTAVCIEFLDREYCILGKEFFRGGYRIE